MIRKEFPDNVAERGRESITEFILNVPLFIKINGNSHSSTPATS